MHIEGRPRNSRQRGLASVETILVMPFLLFFVLAAVASTKLLLIKSHNRADVRTAAWQKSLLQQSCSRSTTAFYGGSLGSINCSDSGSVPSRFYPLAYSGGDAAAFANVLKRAPQPAATVATARASYAPGRQQLSLVTRHGVDVTPVWEMDALPIGYDRYLRGEYSRKLFPNYFPKVR